MEKQIGCWYLFVVLMLSLKINYFEDGIEFVEDWPGEFQWDPNTFLGF